MKKRKKRSKGKADDPVETAFLLRYQQKCARSYLIQLWAGGINDLIEKGLKAL